MGVKRALSILILIFLASWADTEASNISVGDSVVMGELSEISAVLTESNLKRTEFFKVHKFSSKISVKANIAFFKKGLALSSIKNSLLIIPGLNLAKLIFPFHFFT